MLQHIYTYAGISRGVARTTDSDGKATGDTITLTDVDGLKTNKVGKSGSVFIGREFTGETVTVAFRVEEQEQENEEIEATSD